MILLNIIITNVYHGKIVNKSANDGRIFTVGWPYLENIYVDYLKMNNFKITLFYVYII